MSAFVPDGVTITALLTLDEDRSLKFSRRPFLDEFRFLGCLRPPYAATTGR